MTLLGHPFLSWFWLVQILDIALVSTLAWLLLRAIWDKPAMRVVVAVVLMWGASQILNTIGFYSIGMITRKFASVAIFALIVIFSQEVKDLLARFGRYLSRIGFLDFRYHRSEKEMLSAVEAVVETCRYLREKGYGGLIVLEREENTSENCRDAFDLDELPVSARLLESFLTPPGPYHDGAIVLKGDKILAARAILPLTLPGSDTMLLGTRHRAAKGLAEKTDAVVVVVSEETGSIRVAFDGKLTGSYSEDSLRTKLEILMSLPDKKDIS
ncbi:hypothetical protein CSA37_00225 [Candidatus Fermentibacteria bacterium]|nr:MAG: hypothetical protein CSA37_00225 [Candidatus Fermentibacteria bacterium]